MSSGFLLCAVICIAVSLSPSSASFLCFDDQRSEHSFVADRSDIKLVDDGNNAMTVRR